MKKVLMVSLLITIVLLSCEDPCACPSFCTCNPTAHLGINETCTCGGVNCECTEQTGTVYNIPVRKAAGVTVKQMNAAVTRIENAIKMPQFTDKNKFAELITEIHIVSGNAVNYQNGIMTVGYDSNFDSIGEKLQEIYADTE